MELRAKNRTISKLKRQGEQYKLFNKEVHYLIEPDLHKEALVNQLKNKPNQKNDDLTPSDDIKQKVEMINRGLEFQHVNKDIKSGDYFHKKYNLDF